VPRERATSQKVPQHSICRLESEMLVRRPKRKGLTVTKPVHPAAIASNSTTVACTKARAVFAPSATFNATPNRMLT